MGKNNNGNRKTRKKSKVLNGVSCIFGVILLLVNILLFYLIFDLNIIPTKYFSIICGVLIPIFIIMEIFLMIPKIRKGLKKFSIGFSFIIIILFSVIIYYLYNTNGFLGKFKFKNYQIESFYVVVLKDNGFDNIDDLKGYKIGTLKIDDEEYKEAIEKIDEKINVDFEENPVSLDLARDLLNDEIDAVLLDDSYKVFMEEQLSDFTSKTVVLYTVEIKTEKENIVKKVDVANEPFNIYISGIDTSGNITNVSRSDVNMIMTVNPKTGKILLTSIPRDYYVQLHGTTGYRDKLTHSGTYGINMTIQTVEDLLDVDINYYIRVNFTTLIKLVDVIGGIDVYSDKGFIPWTNNAIYIPKGNVHMNGTMALAFARERHAYIEGDRHRVQNQQDVFEAIFKKITNTSTLITSYTSILDTIDGCFETNMDKDVITSLAKFQINNMPSWNIEKISVNGTDSSNYTYSYAGQKLYVMEPDMETVKAANLKINEVLGKTTSGE